MVQLTWHDTLRDGRPLIMLLLLIIIINYSTALCNGCTALSFHLLHKSCGLALAVLLCDCKDISASMLLHKVIIMAEPFALGRRL